MSDLNSVVVSQKPDESWEAKHIPSGKVTFGLSRDEALEEMRNLLGMDKSGNFDEPLTNDRFEGVGKDIALFLEGPISDMLKSHSGFARLEAFEQGIAHVRLGGGCEGCPSSTFTLVQGVKEQLQDRFGEDNITDVAPVF